MLVYRIEHRELCVGPFNSRWNMGMTELECDNIGHFNNEWTTHHDMVSHPTPQEDGIFNFIPREDFCGVRSLDEILDWFGQGDCLTYLKSANFVLRVFSIYEHHIQYGRSQIALRRAHATIVEEIEL